MTMASEPLQVHEGEGELTPDEIQFYCTGFHVVLKRFCVLTVVGWAITALGFIGVLLLWKTDLPHGMLDLLPGVAAFVAGILVVQINVTALQSYVQVPFPPGERPAEKVLELRRWMQEVADGDWRDACAVLRRLDNFVKTVPPTKEGGHGESRVGV
jgi:hypothetical protein